MKIEGIDLGSDANGELGENLEEGGDAADCWVEDVNFRAIEKPKRHLPRRRSGQKHQLSAAVVRMSDASGISFVWRTAGVRDTEGAELHEGEAYRLVASVRDPPDLVRKEVSVTRCRLTHIVDHTRD